MNLFYFIHFLWYLFMSVIGHLYLQANVVQTISFGLRPNHQSLNNGTLYSIRRKTARTLLIKDYANSLTNTNRLTVDFHK